MRDLSPLGDYTSFYAAAGGEEGLKKLVDAFYKYMDSLPLAQNIRVMHPKDLTLASEKLAAFLSGFLGGPMIYPQKYGRMNMMEAHKMLKINTSDRDAWLKCMELALADQPYSGHFKAYLLEWLSVPAERIRATSAAFNSK